MSIYETHKPSQGGGDYLKLKDGDRVKLRFVTQPAGVTYKGDKLRYQWIVFNHSADKPQTYEAGPQVFGQLAELYSEWGDPQDFDVIISRKGSGQFDTEYTVTPVKNSTELTPDQKKLVTDAKENFPGPKAKWLSDIEKDGKFPDPIMGEQLEDPFEGLDVN